MSADETSVRTEAPSSLTRARRAARNGRGISLAGLVFGLYLLVIALLLLVPFTEANALGSIFIAVVGLFIAVVGGVGLTRSTKRVKAFEATHGRDAGRQGAVA